MNRFAKILGLALTFLVVIPSYITGKPNICENPDNICTFPGGIYYGLNKWLSHNFKYPVEAWKHSREESVRVKMTIGENGQVIDYSYSQEIHPLLKSELDRVIKKMQWYPAYKNGKPVNVNVDISLGLTPNIFDGLRVPFGLEDIVRNGDLALSELNRRHFTDKGKDARVISELAEAADLFPNLPNYSIGYAGYCASKGMSDKALNSIDSCWKEYSIDPLELKDHNGRRIWHNAYSGRTEIWLGIVRALHHTLAKSNQTDIAFTDAFRLINDRIEDGDLMDNATPWKDEQRRTRRMQDLQRERVNEFFSNSEPLAINTPEWEKILRNYSLEEISSSLGYWSNNGLIDNAQVAQLTGLLDQERKTIHNGEKATSKEYERLFGCKAMTVWALEGESGLKNFIMEIRSGKPSKKLLSYLDKLEENYEKYASVLSDYNGVMLAIVSPIPPQGADEAACKAFYERRRAAEKVFPIKWLAGN